MSDSTSRCRDLVIVLDSHLRAAGRENVALLGVLPVRRLLDRMVHDAPPPDSVAQPALAAAVAELSACLADPGREPRAEVFDRVDAVVHLAASLREHSP